MSIFDSKWLHEYMTPLECLLYFHIDLSKKVYVKVLKKEQKEDIEIFIREQDDLFLQIQSLYNQITEEKNMIEHLEHTVHQLVSLKEKINEGSQFNSLSKVNKVCFDESTQILVPLCTYIEANENQFSWYFQLPDQFEYNPLITEALIQYYSWKWNVRIKEKISHLDYKKRASFLFKLGKEGSIKHNWSSFIGAI